MTHASLFSGIGGFDIAAEWMGWHNAFNCEKDPFGRHILNYYWPEAESFIDIKESDFKKYANKIDILTGGFPCQPYSLAGKRRGKYDDRHLWPEMLRAIREILPRYIVAENVYGLVGWNRGMVFEEIWSEMEDEGYEIQPVILPASAVSAPHRRDRVWIVAHSSDARVKKMRQDCDDKVCGARYVANPRSHGLQRGGQQRVHGEQAYAELEGSRPTRLFTHPDSLGLRGKVNRDGVSRFFDETGSIPGWENFPTQSPVCSGDDGLSERLDIETILKIRDKKVSSRFNPFNWWRKESIKAYGNAIVPQVALEIFKVIDKYEKCLKQG